MRLSDYLAANNLRLREFAALMDVHLSTVHNWAEGKRTPDIATAAKIEKITGGAVTARDFLDVTSTTAAA